MLAILDLESVFSIPGTGIGLVVAFGFGLYLHFRKFGVVWGGNDVLTTIIPCVTLFLSTWAYGASAITSTIADARDADRNEQLAQQTKEMARQADTMEIMLAESKGIARFQAHYDDDWNVILRRRDGRKFYIATITLIPNYQVDRNEGPIDGGPIDVVPKFNEDGNAITILAARNIFCRAGQPVCEGQRNLRRLYLKFQYNGEAHRIAPSFEGITQ